MKRLTYAAIVLALALGAAAWAEVLGGSITVTVASATTTLGRTASSLSLSAPSTNAVAARCRVFTTSDTAAAATTSSPLVLDPGTTINIRHDPRTSSGSGYTSFACITASSTATVTYVAD